MTPPALALALQQAKILLILQQAVPALPASHGLAGVLQAAPARDLPANNVYALML